ncbi:MAG: esterase family protein [Ferruginibacter sp.]|nr:esterase family protein [Ferruginibacter sp.]
MSGNKTNCITIHAHILNSVHLKRDVKVDCYLPVDTSNFSNVHLLLINDGQDLRTMQFEEILDDLISENLIAPIFCVGIHCSADRKNEYGTAKILDYKGRGAKSAAYSRFVMEELLPFIRKTYHILSFREKSFAGFSLGGLSALDIVWNNPGEFHVAAVFSGSLWWRDKDQQDADFDETKNRIMHRQIREGQYHPWLKFFFEVGTMDEVADRNNNGVIDSIDDTRSLIEELKIKGYKEPQNISYLELQDGKHDVPTWAKAFPNFLIWGWGKAL